METITSLAASRAAAAIDAVDDQGVQDAMSCLSEDAQSLLTLLCEELPQKQAIQIVMGVVLGAIL
jgi:flagellar motor switch protein FliG